MSPTNTKATPQRELFFVSLFFVCISLAAFCSRPANATPARYFLPSLFDSAWSDIALPDLFSFLHEGSKKGMGDPYSLLAPVNENIFVYPLLRREDQAGSAPSGQPDHNVHTGSDYAEAMAEAQDEAGTESADSAPPEAGATALDETGAEPADSEGATNYDEIPYRSWLMEQVQSINLNFFRPCVPLTTHPSDELVRELRDSPVERKSNEFLELLIVSHLLQTCTQEEREQWLKKLLMAPPQIFQLFLYRNPLLGNLLTDLSQEVLDALEAKVPEHNRQVIIDTLKIIFSLLQHQEQGISTEENQYYTTLSAGRLPSVQPPQRSVILTLSDFQNPDISARISEGASEALLRPFNRLSTPEERYQMYLGLLASIFANKTAADLICFAKRVYALTHPIHRLIEEYGIHYVPSDRWLTPVVESINQQVQGNPLGLEIAAGSGSLTHFLSQHYGIPMVATDNSSLQDRDYTDRTPESLRASVEHADAVSAIRHHPEANFLVLSWPSRFTPNISRATLQEFESISLGIKEKDDVSYVFVTDFADEYDPFLSAIMEWGDRGPILFIGELGEHSATGSPVLRTYLQNRYASISFREFYQSLPGSIDYPVLFIPKGDDSSEEATNKSKGEEKPQKTAKK